MTVLVKSDSRSKAFASRGNNPAMGRRDVRDASRPESALSETVRGLLDADKIEVHKHTILTLLQHNSDALILYVFLIAI